MVLYSLQQYTMRWALASMGVGAGVCVTVVIANGIGGLYMKVTTNVRRADANTILASATGAGRPLTVADGAVLAHNPAVLSVTPRYSIRELLDACGKAAVIDAVGVLANYDYSEDLRVEEGRFIRQSDLEGYGQVAVVGADVRSRYPCIGLGATIRIGGVNAKVIGFLEPRTSNFQVSTDSNVYLPASTLNRQYGASVRGAVTLAISVKTKPEAVTPDIRRVLRRLHGVAATEKDDVVVMTPTELQDAWAKLAAQVTRVLFWLLAVCQVTAALGLLNTIFMSVLHRTAEFGLRRATGATRNAIAFGVLGESVLIAFGGATGGAATGILLGLGIAQVCGIPDYVNWRALSAAGGLAILLSALVGLGPAVRAAYQTPVEALRHEA